MIFSEDDIRKAVCTARDLIRLELGGIVMERKVFRLEPEVFYQRVVEHARDERRVEATANLAPEPAHVYVVFAECARNDGAPSEYGNNAIRAGISLKAAKHSAETYGGEPLTWMAHNGHGEYWTATGGPRGDKFTMKYSILPFILEGAGPAPRVELLVFDNFRPEYLETAADILARNDMDGLLVDCLRDLAKAKRMP